MGAKPSFEYLNMNYILHNFEYYEMYMMPCSLYDTINLKTDKSLKTLILIIF